MTTTVGEKRKSEAWAEVLPSENITLLSRPRPTDDASVVVRTPTSLPGPSASTASELQETNPLNVLLSSALSSRPFMPLSTPPKPLVTPQSNAGGGGFRSGASTPNAGLGGGTPTGGGGGGPGLVNANQFVGVDFGATPGSTPVHNMTPPTTPIHPDASASSQASTPATALQTSYSLTPPSLLGSDYASLSPSLSYAHSHGHGLGHDPLYVLDLNTGQTIPANVTLNTFASGPSMSNWTENLLAQVSGGAVASYSWNLSQAPDAVNVSGQNSANLQFAWASFTGPARTDIISVTETPQSGSPLTQTFTFDVAGYDSPAWSFTPPTSSSTWPTVITPDQLSSSQASQATGPYASIGLADGSAQTSFSMPS